MVAETCGVTHKAKLVVSVAGFCMLCRRLLLIGRLLQAFGPLMFFWATRVAVHLARSALAIAVFVSASQGLLLSRLIVMRAIPIASQAFAMVAF